MNTSKNLTIASLVLGGVGALLFIIYKVRGGKKSSLMANGSKLLIAIGIILLAIAVLLLSEDREPYSNRQSQCGSGQGSTVGLLQPPDYINQYFLTKITGLEKNTLHSLSANDLVLGLFESDKNGEINIQELVQGKIQGLPMPVYDCIRIRPFSMTSTNSNPKGEYEKGIMKQNTFTLETNRGSIEYKIQKELVSRVIAIGIP